ncbi:hypothetical protein EJ04DRAFT_511700 [Polyplosphaeria fusca]|uniref:F-box domain-containing protein n=1 Tax=Polyplosphaeria fusca TaxID=682080 RepID=A0A9P4R2H3_9PLEO|nr:hypothetical protein EJ04DRAFT_511700 [Polyplosphaeria fusca]
MNTDPSPLLALPAEIIQHVLSFLSLSDLLLAGRVSRALHEHSLEDTLWQPLVQANIPISVSVKPPRTTWRQLFMTHHPFWFIPKHKIWFADNPATGKLLIARYDHRLNSIEGYALVAERRQPRFMTWDWNPEAIIHTFNPRILLDLNAPVIRLDASAYECAVGEGGRLGQELPMNLIVDPSRFSGNIYSRLMLTKPWPTNITGPATPVWPPQILPSPVRTRNDSPSQFHDLGHRPTKLSELSSNTFRIRRWMEFSSRTLGVSSRMGEATTTWATLPTECYTPTPQKPWQGIWCGDYAGHGCEFLVVLQPDHPNPLPERAELVMRMREREGSVSSQESWETASEGTASAGEGQAFDMTNSPEVEMQDSVATLHATTVDEPASPVVDDDEDLYHGRIEAVKLTGDPNIPRGEYTFIAPDIGPDGLIRIAQEKMFRGARVVKSVGHIAARGFREDDYMASQLILISHDRMAQYWETFGHVSFYERVNIDEFTKID